MERKGTSRGEAGAGERASRPWWGNPQVWLGVVAVSLVLGLVVAPRFLAGVVVFLPLVWVGRLHGPLWTGPSPWSRPCGGSG